MAQRTRGATEETKRVEQGVCLPRGQSGAQLLARLLEEAVAAFPAAFGALRIPRGKAFRKGYAEVVTRFEALRAASPARGAIALFLARRQLECFEVVRDQTISPLLESLPKDAAPFPLVTGEGAPSAQPLVEIDYLGKTHRAAEVAALANELFSRHGATRAAVRALEWIAARGGAGGTLDLSGHAFAILGASAEIAPTERLIHAGARVLWIDLKEPPPALQRANVQWVQGGADLLAAPERIARTLEQFGAAQPFHLVACAYAPGRGREWRLAVAMSAIANQLPRALVRSLVMLLSPTSPAAVEPEDLEAVRPRAKQAHFWQSALAKASVLGPPHIQAGAASVVRSIVPIQGPTYQAAQYLAKRICAEAFALYGLALDAADPQPLLVSANVAPITRTRSLKHPLFEAAFLGAPAFGVEIFDPPATRALGLLLALHDLLNPDAPAAPSRAARQPGDIFRQQLHSGIYGMPWALANSISASAVLGLGKKPGILLKMF